MGSLPGFGRVIIKAFSISGGREDDEAASLYTEDINGAKIEPNCL